MPSTSRRELNVAVPPLKLIGCIAVGIWLGFIAVLLTCTLLYKALPAAQTQVVSTAVSQLSKPPTPAEEPASSMFEKYQQNLRKSEARQAREQAQAEQQKSFNGPKCNFWIQQDRTAPSDKSRANVSQFCG